MTLKEMVLKKIMGKGENTGNQHFLLFLQCFRLNQIQKSPPQLHSSFAVASYLAECKICLFGKELTDF